MADRTLDAPHTQVIADAIAAGGDGAHLDLARARAGLLARLHNRSDDFAATNELQAVSALAARRRSHSHPLESDRLVHAGLSSVERTRIWLRSKTRGRDRGSQQR
jgi:hypothetical protein